MGIGPWQAYEWIVVVGGLACFWSGWTIGEINVAALSAHVQMDSFDYKILPTGANNLANGNL